MKVHVLWYDYYEDSGIVGIYTEEGKKKKIEELRQESIGYCKEWGEEYEKTLIKKKEERTIHLKKVNQAIEACKSSPENKSFRQLKKVLLKKMKVYCGIFIFFKEKWTNIFSPKKLLKFICETNIMNGLKVR